MDWTKVIAALLTAVEANPAKALDIISTVIELVKDIQAKNPQVVTDALALLTTARAK